MATDKGIGLYAVGSAVRASALHRATSEGATAMRPTAPVKAVTDALPSSRLINMANELAEQGPPVDVSRIASLRNAIASGSYAIDPTSIAEAMLRFHKGSA